MGRFATRAWTGLLATAAVFTIGATEAAAQPAPTGLPHGVAKIDLGGVIEYSREDFTVASPPRRAITHTPFTAEEILAVAPKAKVKGEGRGTLVLVQNEQGHKWVPLPIYLTNLNAYEAFVNKYGYSLRDGALAPARRAGEDKLPPQPVRRDLGLRFLLKPVETVPVGGRDTAKKADTKAQQGFQPYFVPEEIIGPSGDPTRQRVGGDYARGWKITQAPKTKAYLDLSVTGMNSAGAQVNAQNLNKGLDKAVQAGPNTAKLAGAAPETKVMSGCLPQQECKLAYGVHFTLSQRGQDIVNNVYVKSTWRCKVDTEGTAVDDPKKCINGVAAERKIFAQEFFASEYPGQTWLTTYQDLCKWKAQIDSDAPTAMFKGLYTQVSNDIPASSVGNQDILTGEAAANFFDGTLSLKVTNIKDCFGQASDNGWFAAYACSMFDTNNQYTPKNGFLVDNSAALDSKVSLFGMNVTLLKGATSIHWQQPTGANAVVPQNPVPTVTEASTSSSLDPQSSSQTYDGPKAIIPIGPVPLTITSSLTAGMSIAPKTPIHITPAIKKPDAGKDILGVGVAATAAVDVKFDAAIDAVVASAGVEGKLQLISLGLDGSIISTIDTGANTGHVDKVYQMSGNALKGTLSAFVEVDLLLYTKRWSVGLAGFDGIPLDQPIKSIPYDAKAVLPATAAANCQ